MNDDTNRLLRSWLGDRDPGVAPLRLRTAAARVPDEFGRATFPRIDAIRARFFRLALPLRAAILLLVVATLVVAVVGALVLRPWQPFPPRGLIAYTAPNGATGGSGIRLVAADGTGARTVTPATSGAFDHSPRWSADGRTLLFARVEPLEDTSYCAAVGSVVLYDLATATEKVLAADLRPIAVAEWSPLGSRIAVTHPQPGCGDPTHLSVVDVASGSVTTSRVGEGPWRLTWSGEAAMPVMMPAEVLFEVTADGELVARCDPLEPDGPGPIEVEDLATGTTVTLGMGASPAWSPDGRTLAFASAPEPIAPEGAQRFQLAVADADGWDVRLLGEVIAVDDLAGRSFRQLELRWSPDGSSIYWTDARGGHVVDVATGRFANLPAAVSGSSDPRWQPPTR